MLSAVAIVISCMSFILNYFLTRDLSVSQKISNTTNLFHNKYINRELDKELEIGNGIKTKKLAVLRSFVREKYPFGDRSDVGCHAIEEFVQKSITAGEWENYFVQELLHGLQDVGIAVACGAVSLPMVMADTAHTIIEDWRYSQVYLDHWRKSTVEPLHATNDPSLPWSRRHGEWLVCLAAIYIAKFWDCPETDLLLRECKITKDIALRREKQIRTYEWKLASHGFFAKLSPIGLLAEISDLKE